MAAKKLDAFVVSFGGEDFFLDRDLERAKAWKDRKVVVVSGEDVDERQFVSLCETNDMEGWQKVVILDDAQKLKNDKVMKAYVASRESNDQGTVVVAIVRSEKCPELWSQAAKKGRLIEHKKLKTWDSNNEVVKWLAQEARRLGLVLEDTIAELLFQAVGSDLYRLYNELNKLLILVGPNGKVGVEQVKLVTVRAPNAEPYQVAEAAFSKDARRAMNTLSTVYRVMGDEAHVPITFSLIKQVEKFVLARSMLDKNLPEDEVSLALGMNPWRYKNQFLPLVQRHRMPDLIKHLGRLRKLDADVKSSARSKRTLVELAVMSIAV